MSGKKINDGFSTSYSSKSSKITVCKSSRENIMCYPSIIKQLRNFYKIQKNDNYSFKHLLRLRENFYAIIDIYHPEDGLIRRFNAANSIMVKEQIVFNEIIQLSLLLDSLCDPYLLGYIPDHLLSCELNLSQNNYYDSNLCVGLFDKADDKLMGAHVFKLPDELLISIITDNHILLSR